VSAILRNSLSRGKREKEINQSKRAKSEKMIQSKENEQQKNK
jgi:hypothetical protein